MKVPTDLIEEATRLGIVPGATVSDRYNDEAVVPPHQEWKYEVANRLPGSRGHRIIVGSNCYLLSNTKGWAEIITPAPASTGLQEGDAVECGPAMRAAIIELAKELGMETSSGRVCDSRDTCCKGIWYDARYNTIGGYLSIAHLVMHTPEAFIAKMRVTASLPKPIMIDGNEVKWEKGVIKVGCQTINNDTVRAIAAKLIDP